MARLVALVAALAACYLAPCLAALNSDTYRQLLVEAQVRRGQQCPGLQRGPAAPSRRDGCWH